MDSTKGSRLRNTFNHRRHRRHHVLLVGKAQEGLPYRGVYSCLRSVQQQPGLSSCLATKKQNRGYSTPAETEKVENTNEENSVFHGAVNLELEYIHVACLSETMSSVESLTLEKEVSSKSQGTKDICFCVPQVRDSTTYPPK